MGFLKKNSAPSELPDLAIEGLNNERIKSTTNIITKNEPILTPRSPTPKPNIPTIYTAEKKETDDKNHLTPESNFDKIPSKEKVIENIHEDIKKTIDETVLKNNELQKNSFFNNVLEDLNDGMSDVGKLEDWYKKKFVDEDVISNMKGYWEGNKADIIIRSFGAEYKKQISDKVETLKKLEENWREIYFKLIKKEEEMKKEERELKDTVAEFVDLCKRRKNVENKK